MPFRNITMQLEKLQQDINFVPDESDKRKTKRVELSYNQ